jgi:protein farnesyltransferase subunit beta
MALTTDIELTKLMMKVEGLETKTSDDQEDVEELIADIFSNFKAVREDGPLLERESHVRYLQAGLQGFGRGYSCLDASRPWLVYWTIHSLELLDAPIEAAHQKSCIELLSRCQDPTGGFGGGPGQLPHLAPTYAAVNALATIGTEEALALINRSKLHEWLLRMKKPDGSFTMHQDGETDVRAAYCAVSVATLTNIVTPGLFDTTAEWVGRCQTYEGGISAEPGDEAHGGYAFCGLAALAMLGATDRLNAERMLHWTAHRQMLLEGGFQGRSNKLVDGCYSFWVGGVFPLLHNILNPVADEGMSSTAATDGNGGADVVPGMETLSINGASKSATADAEGRFCYSQAGLQDYILYCCQVDSGGLRDKPGKGRDYYHTCYCLSGLSSSQHNVGGGEPTAQAPEDVLIQIHPHHNVSVRKVTVANAYFHGLPQVAQ